MNAITIIGGACFVLGLIAAPLSAQSLQSHSATNLDCTQWVEGCLRDFKTIQPGMTRGEIEQSYPTDGGLQSVSPVRFVHPTCPYLKIDVEFNFKRDPNDQNRAIKGENDTVTKVSKPYVEQPYHD